MIGLTIHVEGDNCWPDLKNREIIKGDLVSVAALPEGMTSGRTSVGFRVELPDGKVVFCETTMRLFLNAANIFKVKYGNELEGPA